MRMWQHTSHILLYICVLILPHTGIYVSVHTGVVGVAAACMAAAHVTLTDLPEHIKILGTQFTCFTGTKVQILTQKALLEANLVMNRRMLTYADVYQLRMLTYADVC